MTWAPSPEYRAAAASFRRGALVRHGKFAQGFLKRITVRIREGRVARQTDLPCCFRAGAGHGQCRLDQAAEDRPKVRDPASPGVAIAFDHAGGFGDFARQRMLPGSRRGFYRLPPYRDQRVLLVIAVAKPPDWFKGGNGVQQQEAEQRGRFDV